MITFLLGLYVGGMICMFGMLFHEKVPLRDKIFEAVIWPWSLAEYMTVNEEDLP